MNLGSKFNQHSPLTVTAIQSIQTSMLEYFKSYIVVLLKSLWLLVQYRKVSVPLTVGVVNGVILQPSFVTVPSSGMSRVTWSLSSSNLISVDWHLAEG